MASSALWFSLAQAVCKSGGGDPYLYELYSRINAATFEVSCRLENTIGGDGDARYEKYHINCRGLILGHNLRNLEQKLEMFKNKGICLDIVVPSYRVDNEDFLRRIVLLRATVDVYVKFWIGIDNLRHDHIESVTKMANELNEQQLQVEGNYFISVIYSWTTMSSPTRIFLMPTLELSNVTHVPKCLWD
jgi:hypothetical protein